jgi:hypothetical protein
MNSDPRRLPGFTAETALLTRGERYRQNAARSSARDNAILPAGQCCAPCGKDLCCDDCPPEPGDGGGEHRIMTVRGYRNRYSLS